MSLDVYLESPCVIHKPAAIYVRENGAVREISREEWNEKYPGREPVMVESSETHEVFSRNITHNLNKMAAEAGIYEALWRPEEIGITTAEQLIDRLQAGIKWLEAKPDFFKQFNPSNGWGNYEGLVDFVRDYLKACKEHPKAIVRVSR